MLNPLYNRRKDIVFFNNINRELINKIVKTEVSLFKINPTETEENLYGESTKKTYSPGIRLYALITRDDEVTETDEFGPTVLQNIILAFHRPELKERNVYPEVGDIVDFNDAYYEIGGIVENQFVGGLPTNNFSFVCNAVMTSRDKLQIEEIRVGINRTGHVK